MTATGLGLLALMASDRWWLLAIPLAIVSAAGMIWVIGPVGAGLALDVKGGFKPRIGTGFKPQIGTGLRPAHTAALVEAPPAALLVLGSSIFLRQVEGSWRWISVGIAILLLIALLLGRYYSLDPRSRLFGSARFASNLVVYLLALGYFAAVYGMRARSLQSATAIMLVAFVLALYSLGPQVTRRSLLAAAVSGMMMGEVTWGLNYWPLGGLVGGLFLLLVFYGLTGTLHSYLAGRLTRGILVEFVTVLLAGFALLAVSSLWVG